MYLVRSLLQFPHMLQRRVLSVKKWLHLEHPTCAPWRIACCRSVDVSERPTNCVVWEEEEAVEVEEEGIYIPTFRWFGRNQFGLLSSLWRQALCTLETTGNTVFDQKWGSENFFFLFFRMPTSLRHGLVASYWYYITILKTRAPSQVMGHFSAIVHPGTLIYTWAHMAEQGIWSFN